MAASITFLARYYKEGYELLDTLSLVTKPRLLTPHQKASSSPYSGGILPTKSRKFQADAVGAGKHG